MYFSDVDGVTMAPLLEEFSHYTMDQLPAVQEAYANKSTLSKDGTMEGIVVSDLSKEVPLNEVSFGPLRFKMVNAQFKETRQIKGVASDNSNSLSSWLNSNITLPRIRKQIYSLQEDGKLNGSMDFDWLRNGVTDEIAKETLLDAIKESEVLPEALQGLVRYSKKQTNKFVALSVKGLI